MTLVHKIDQPKRVRNDAASLVKIKNKINKTTDNATERQT